MIELFKQPNIDWMGKAKYFFALSGLLLIIGWSAIFFKGGIKYGIDFKRRHQRGRALRSDSQHR